MAIRYGCKSKCDTIPRVIASVILSITALLLIFVLGFNNSSRSANFPTMLNNCSVVTSFGAIDPKNLKKSTDIFCGIMFVTIILGVAYEVFVIVGRKLLKIEFIVENNKYWGCLDLFINSFLMYAMFATTAGAFVLAYLRNQYEGLFNGQLPNTTDFDVTNGFLWATFGFSMNGVYQTYNVSLTMARILAVKSALNKEQSEEANPELSKLT